MAAHQISTKYTNFSAGLVREFALFVASGLSILAAAIHLWAVPEHVSEWWGYGAFFVATALLQGLFAVALLRRPNRPLLLAGIFANLGVVAFYIVTRTAGIPYFGPHAGMVEEAGALDLTAATGQPYTSQIQVPSSRTIRARAFDGAGNPSPVATLAYEIDTVAPTVGASPPGGLFKEAQSVSLGSDPGTKIFYTTDGSSPSRSSTEFTGGAVPVDRSKTIWTLAVDEAGNETRQAFVYTIDMVAPTVGASLPAGSYDPEPSREVSLNASEDADVYFTTDGSLPSPGSPGTTKGAGPVRLDRTTTLKAVAVDRAGNVGAVASFGYVIRQPTRVSLQVATGNLQLDKTRPISGSVSPAGAGRSVRMTIYTPGTARNVTKTLPLEGASRYNFAYTPQAAGVYSVRVSFLKDADHLGSTSPLASFRVIR